MKNGHKCILKRKRQRYLAILIFHSYFLKQNRTGKQYKLWNIPVLLYIYGSPTCLLCPFRLKVNAVALLERS